MDLMAAEAGLVYVDSDSPGFRRVRKGRGFTYLNGHGQSVNGDVRKRIEKLAIPPAWQDVWISKDPNGHIQATGHDKVGRKQYIYHPTWELIRDEVKFDRMEPFGASLSRIRRQIDADLRQPGLPRTKVIALAVAVLDRTLIRVGNRRYARDNESYGLTTLTADHTEVAGRRVHFRFNGKGNAEHQLLFEDSRMARLVSQCQELGGQTLFSYETSDSGPTSITSSDVNQYLDLASSKPFTAKDFRTWGASALVVGALASGKQDALNGSAFLNAVDEAAMHLGNTRAVCRSSYVHPAIEEAAENGVLADIWKRARPGKWIDRSESALRILIEGSADVS